MSEDVEDRSKLYEKSLSEVRERMHYEDGLEDILDTVLEEHPGYPPFKIVATQLRDEIHQLTNIVKKQNPKTILEIGTSQGGTFYIWNRIMEDSELIVSLDLFGGRFGGGYVAKKTEIYENFNPTTETVFVRKNSHDQRTLEEISAHFESGIDFLFIDGDHTYDGVKQDFEMYRPLVNDDGIIAFHDVVDFPNTEAAVESRRKTVGNIEERHLLWSEEHQACNVNKFWTELKNNNEYETEEIISHPKQTWGGIGVVRLG